MSQAGANSNNGSGAPVVETLTGNSGGAVGPDGAFNIDVLGNNSVGIDVVGTPASNLLTIIALDASTSQQGTIILASDAESIAGTDSTKAIVPSSLAAKLGAQTADGIPYGTGTAAAVGWTSGLTDGQLVIGSTAGIPAAANLTSTGASIAITNGANSINLETASAVATQFNTDSGNAVPSSGIIEILGGTGISTSGASNTVTITLDTPVAVADGGTGLSSTTAYAVICGGTTSTNPLQSIAGVGSAGEVLTSNGAGALPTFQAASGDVSGPGSSTDNALARWDGTGGDTLQDSTVIVSDAGEMTNASQPAFLGYLASSDTNATGDNTLYTLGGTTALTEVFDQGSDFTTSGVFTAPVTGKYQLSSGIWFSNLGAGHTSGNAIINTSNRNYSYQIENVGAIRSAGSLNNVCGINESVLADMDAADVASITCKVESSTKTVSVFGSSGVPSFFSGVLIC